MGGFADESHILGREVAHGGRGVITGDGGVSNDFDKSLKSRSPCSVVFVSRTAI